jgi:hypothetical protein
MASDGFHQAAHQWLRMHLRGDGRCPRCSGLQWRVSDPGYPVIQFTCELCGHIVRTDMTSIDDASRPLR